MKFSTAGSMGDSIYQVLFMLELCEACHSSMEEIHIQYGKKGCYSQKHPYGDLQLTKNAAEFLAPLFMHQGWLTTVSDKVPEGFIDIDLFRQQRMNFASGDIRLWCYSLVENILPMNLKRRVLTAQEDTSFNGKMLLAKTSRYNNVFMDYTVLKPYAKDIVFMGLEEEHRAFCDDYFKVEYFKPMTAYEAAKAIAGCKFMVANQCGLYSIAEMMKTPRILCTAEFIDIVHPYTNKEVVVPGPCNVIPQGGICSIAATTAKLVGLLKAYEKGWQ